MTGVTAAMVPLLGGNNWGNSVEVEGFPSGPDTDTNASLQQDRRRVTSGRSACRCSPAASSPRPTRPAARRWPSSTSSSRGSSSSGGTPSASTSRRARGTRPQIEIVGVVADAKYSEVKDAPPPQFFVPYRQDETLGFLNFYVRTHAATGAAAGDDPEGRRAPRPEPARRGPADDGAAGARERRSSIA